MGELTLDRYYSEEEYFSILQDSEVKYEYVNGFLISMAGASINHNRICQNLTRNIGNSLEEKGSKCEVFGSDQKVAVASRKTYFFPDVTVICPPFKIYEKDKDSVENPVVILEVSSKSTHGFDAGGKFNYYQSLLSLKEFILVDQFSVFITAFHKVDEMTWKITQLTDLEENLTISSLNITIPVKSIYRNVSKLNK